MLEMIPFVGPHTDIMAPDMGTNERVTFVSSSGDESSRIPEPWRINDCLNEATQGGGRFNVQESWQNAHRSRYRPDIIRIRLIPC